MEPSDFLKMPIDSVMRNAESEIVALNIMVILSRTGDTFRPLTWDEYESERLKDHNFSEREKDYFNEVIAFCKSADTAKLFSKSWAN